MTGVLGGWEDPYPPPVTRTYGLRNGGATVTVVRDDLLGYGTKVRYIDALVSLHPEVEEWVYACPAQGWAQVSLTAVCAKHGRRAVYFAAQRGPGTRPAPQRVGLELGGLYHWVRPGYLSVCQARAREYVARTPGARLLPFGLDDPIVEAAIVKVARGIPGRPPKEVWTVAGSGTLSRGLQAAWPDATVHAVAVGHELTAAEAGRAKLWRAPYKFERALPAARRPPFPSVANYDAKVWPFVQEHAMPGAWVWNVAADLEEG